MKVKQKEPCGAWTDIFIRPRPNASIPKRVIHSVLNVMNFSDEAHSHALEKIDGPKDGVKEAETFL